MAPLLAPPCAPADVRGAGGETACRHDGGGVLIDPKEHACPDCLTLARVRQRHPRALLCNPMLSPLAPWLVPVPFARLWTAPREKRVQGKALFF